MNKEKVLEIFKKYGMILLMNVVLFIALFFLVPILMNKVNANIWRVLFVFVIIGITETFYLTKKIKYEQVLLSLPILFILNLIFLSRCADMDLYGITSHGSLDKTPAIVDALLVDMIIVFIQYLTLLVTRLIIKLATKKKVSK